MNQTKENPAPAATVGASNQKVKQMTFFLAFHL